jgi:hypothetical protein
VTRSPHEFSAVVLRAMESRECAIADEPQISDLQRRTLTSAEDKRDTHLSAKVRGPFDATSDDECNSRMTEMAASGIIIIMITRAMIIIGVNSLR